MIIGGKRYLYIDIQKDDKTIVRFDDDGVSKMDGYDVKAFLDDGPGPFAIAHRGDLLYYRDNEKSLYIVVNADEKFFLMCPVHVKEGTKEITVNSQHPRSYPNDSRIGTLEQYGLVKDFDSEKETGNADKIIAREEEAAANSPCH